MGSNGNFRRKHSGSVLKEPGKSEVGTDDSWSILEEPDFIESINYGILREPERPYLLHPEYGVELNRQLLANNLGYPGRYDKAGYDIVFVLKEAIQDTSHQLSVHYIFDAILGYFYDLNEHSEIVKDVLVVCVLIDKQQIKANLQILTDFLADYKDHNLKLLIVTEKELNEKVFKQIVGGSGLEKAFAKIEHIKVSTLSERMEADAIPRELGGEFDMSVMDLWLNKRLKFEIFWESCRTHYTNLQYIPTKLKAALKEVITENKGNSLETVKQKYCEKASEISFLIDQKSLKLLSKALMEEIKPAETTDDKIMGDAIRTLARVMSEIQSNFNEFQMVLEDSLEAICRWHEFKKEADQLINVSEDLRDRIRDFLGTESEILNEAYTILQNSKTVLQELDKRKDNLPINKQRKAESKLKYIEDIVTNSFCELGKNNEKMVNTEFVLNIQNDILSWIKEFEDILFIAPEPSKEDFLRAMVEKDRKIRIKLKYCPSEVIEEYFETCQKIGTDFLLGSMRGVETCITRMIGNITDTSHEIIGAIQSEATSLRRRIAGLLDRVKAMDEGNVNLVECTTSLEKILSLVGNFSQSQAIEYPEIPDIAFLKEQKAAPLVSYVEILDEVVQTIGKCVDTESDELLLVSNFRRSRTGSNLDRSPFSSSSSKKFRRESLRKMVICPKTTEEYINDMEGLVKNLERIHTHKLIDLISLHQSKKLDKSNEKLYHILKEFKDTEKSYIKHLEYFKEELIQKAVLDEEFILEPEAAECLRNSLSLLQKIIKVNKSMDNQVRNTNGGAIKFARVFTSLINDFRVYADFIKHQSQLQQILTMDYFKDIQDINSEPMPAESFVNKPMQRITKYRLLFEDTLMNTKNVFEVPSINQAVLQSQKLLKIINGNLHLQEELFCVLEDSEFYLYAKVTLLDSTHRKAYLFKNNLYLSKSSKEYISYELDGISLLGVEKPKLEMTLKISSMAASVGNTLKRTSSLKKSKGPITLTLVFSEYNELIEWLFKLKNVLGRFY